ncbi:alkyl hydroperoxide reductase [Mycolicibacterium grossiae]|uniref:Alkyl hydroperoxide reductase n=1 Tax=Mycolicibacterium grossiae TaxID=1552759 RepID=A0A1E8PXN0_9MYCO|nr:peroxiredoxin family protein [Mycolicibacterium grossiae]OFJ51122.1 alkyl hydroperoxide reductase [Mycolicibacterium grossiae]
MSKTTDKANSKPPNRPGATRAVAQARAARGPHRATLIGVAVIAVFAVVVLYLIYQGPQDNRDATAGGSGSAHVAGQPGIGATAPAFALASNTGREISLADYRGKNVLLYFQEGLTCQPCWDQIKDLENNQPALQRAGIEAVVTISSDPVGQITQKTADMKLATPALSDPDLQVISAYGANEYGMMGDSRAGHTFILVGPDGAIRWRADYGGAPNYTMYLPTEKMLADLTQERAA